MIRATGTRQSFCRMFFGVTTALALVSAVPAQAQSDSLARYSALLGEIENMKLTIAQKQLQIQSQEAEIESLNSQIDAVPQFKEAVPGILQQMQLEIRKQIARDLPFKLEERNDRLGAFEESIAKGSEASIGDQMRRALSIYAIEAGYGSNVEAYSGNNPFEAKAGARYQACEADATSTTCGLDEDQAKALEDGVSLDKMTDGLKDGDYLRYGRLALVYLQHDGSEAYRFDSNAKTWEEIGGNQRLEIRRAVRMAKGESAPAVINAPIYVR